MNALLTRPFLTALATVIVGLLTYFHVIPAGAADAYVGEAITAVLAAVSGRAAWNAYVAAKLASVAASVDSGTSVR